MIPPDTTPFTPRPPADCALCSGPLGGNRICCRACLDAASPVYFYAAGYEDSEAVYGTLYALTARGRLAHSECFPISGPTA